MKERGALDSVGVDAATLSAVEVGLGAILHSLHVPLTGHFLSLNQAFLLSRSVKRTRSLPGARFAPATISTVAALLKSLAPAGKKLTPMLAISAQGLLFTGGTLVLGRNPLGTMLGSILLCAWVLLQPILIYLVIFGRTLVDVAEYFYAKTSQAVDFAPDHLRDVLLVILALHAALGCSASWLAWRLPEARAAAWLERLIRAGRGASRARADDAAAGPGVSRVEMPAADTSGISRAGVAARGAARDLLSPLFAVSIALTGVFFYFVEGEASSVIWGLLRPLAAGFVVFFVIRFVSFEGIVTRLRASPFEGLGRALETAVGALKRL